MSDGRWQRCTSAPARTLRVIVLDEADPGGLTVARIQVTGGPGPQSRAYGIRQVFAGLTAVCLTATSPAVPSPDMACQRTVPLKPNAQSPLVFPIALLSCACSSRALRPQGCRRPCNSPAPGITGRQAGHSAVHAETHVGRTTVRGYLFTGEHTGGYVGDTTWHEMAARAS